MKLPQPLSKIQTQTFLNEQSALKGALERYAKAGDELTKLNAIAERLTETIAELQEAARPGTDGEAAVKLAGALVQQGLLAENIQ